MKFLPVNVNMHFFPNMPFPDGKLGHAHSHQGAIVRAEARNEAAAKVAEKAATGGAGAAEGAETAEATSAGGQLQQSSQMRAPPPLRAPSLEEIERAKSGDQSAKMRVRTQLGRVKRRLEKIARWEAEQKGSRALEHRGNGITGTHGENLGNTVGTPWAWERIGNTLGTG